MTLGSLRQYFLKPLCTCLWIAASYAGVCAQPLSQIAARLELPLAVLAQSLNKQMPALLYEAKGFPTDYGVFDFQVYKMDSIRLEGVEAQSALQSHSRLRIEVQGEVRTSVWGMAIRQPMSQSVVLDITLKTALDITPQWDLQTKTTLVRYQWIKAPSLDLGLFRLSLASLADKFIQEQQALLLATFDRELPALVPLRVQVQGIWASLHQPIATGTWASDTLWWQSDTQRLRLTPLRCQGKVLATDFLVDLYAKLRLRVPLVRNVPVLPAYTRAEQAPATQGYTLYIGVQMPKEEVVAKLRRQFVGQEYTHKGQTARLVALDINPDGELWRIDMQMQGAIEGGVVLWGIPTWNSDKQGIKLGDFKYKLEAKSRVSRFSQWLFKGRIQRTLREAIEEPLNIQIQQTLDDFRRQLAAYPLNDLARLQGNIQEFRLSEYQITPESISMQATVTGDIRINITKLF